jgi:hypothetical protein
VARPSHQPYYRGSYYRPYYYRPYYGSYYRPYYYPYYPYYSPYYFGIGFGFGYGSFYGAYGWPWYPYGYGYYPYPYAAYYPAWYDDLGALRIEAKPREAQVYVDGYFAGLVDDFDGMSQRLRAKPGDHEVEIYLPGYQSIKEKVLFRPSTTVKMKTVMQPLAAGEAQSPKPVPSGPPPSASDDPGAPPPDRQPRRPHSYRQAPPSASIDVEPGPAAPPDDSAQARAGYGTLAIRVQPGDAAVFIDGERWEGSDSSDRLRIELSEGAHRIEVQKQGFTTYSTEVQVRRGRVTTLNVSLTGTRQI